MKVAIGVIILVWLLCGIVGAGMLDELDRHHWKAIARGPITLIKAVNDSDAQYPWD